MWKYFWRYETDIPSGLGVEQYSLPHLAWVSAALVTILLIVVIYRRQSPAVRRKMEWTIAVLSACGYVFRWIWALLIGHYDPVEMLPLHLCSLSAIMQFIAVASRKPLFKEFGYACGIPGAAVTFIMPGMGVYPLFHFYYIVFILDHSILVLLPMLWIFGDGFRPDLQRLSRVFMILLAMAIGDAVVNRLLGSNFMFINYAPGDTTLKAAADFFGNPGYQFVMGGILIGVWVFLYLPWVLAKRKDQSPLRRLRD